MDGLKRIMAATPTNAGNFGKGSLMRPALALLGLALLALALGGWRDISGNTINPRYVERIKDGETTKHEIYALFGEPQEISRSPQGVVLKYISYRNAPPMGYKVEREVDEQSYTPFFVDEDKKIKKVPKKAPSKLVRSTLSVWFKPDGDKVAGHEYKEFPEE